MKALSSSASDGSLNWMSYAITLAPAAFSCLITSAWTERGNGHWRLSSSKVTSSIFTTATSCRGDCSPRIENRASTVSRSRSSKTFVP